MVKYKIKYIKPKHRAHPNIRDIYRELNKFLWYKKGRSFKLKYPRKTVYCLVFLEALKRGIKWSDILTREEFEKAKRKEIPLEEVIKGLKAHEKKNIIPHVKDDADDFFKSDREKERFFTSYERGELQKEYEYAPFVLDAFLDQHYRETPRISFTINGKETPPEIFIPLFKSLFKQKFINGRRVNRRVYEAYEKVKKIFESNPKPLTQRQLKRKFMLKIHGRRKQLSKSDFNILLAILKKTGLCRIEKIRIKGHLTKLIIPL